jgi:hypothetical protein
MFLYGLSGVSSLTKTAAGGTAALRTASVLSLADYQYNVFFCDMFVF